MCYCGWKALEYQQVQKGENEYFTFAGNVFSALVNVNTYLFYSRLNPPFFAYLSICSSCHLSDLILGFSQITPRCCPHSVHFSSFLLWGRVIETQHAYWSHA